MVHRVSAQYTFLSCRVIFKFSEIQKKCHEFGKIRKFNNITIFILYTHIFVPSTIGVLL